MDGTFYSVVDDGCPWNLRAFAAAGLWRWEVTRAGVRHAEGQCATEDAAHAAASVAYTRLTGKSVTSLFTVLTELRLLVNKPMTEEEYQDLVRLLAVCCGDEGRYYEIHGVKAAVAYAERRQASLLKEIDRLESELRDRHGRMEKVRRAQSAV